MESIRKVRKEEGEAFANEHGLMFMEMSSKSIKSVEDAFFKLAKEINKRIEANQIDINDEVV